MASMHSGRTANLKAIALRTINPQDCRTFIAQLTDYAIDCDQLSDDTWIAEMAAFRMLDDALDWYTDLDTETRESWKKLRMALLKEAKLRSGGPSFNNSMTAPPPAALIPTPAAAPENTSSTDLSTRDGRIRVETDDPLYSGYLSSALSEDGSLQVTTDACGALTVRYNPNNDFPILHITNSDHKQAALGIHWGLDRKQRKISYHYGRLVIVDSTPPIRSSWRTGKGK